MDTSYLAVQLAVDIRHHTVGIPYLAVDISYLAVDSLHPDSELPHLAVEMPHLVADILEEVDIPEVVLGSLSLKVVVLGSRAVEAVALESLAVDVPCLDLDTCHVSVHIVCIECYMCPDLVDMSRSVPSLKLFFPPLHVLA